MRISNPFSKQKTLTFKNIMPTNIDNTNLYASNISNSYPWIVDQIASNSNYYEKFSAPEIEAKLIAISKLIKPIKSNT